MHDVRSGKSGLDTLQRIPSDILNPKLLDRQHWGRCTHAKHPLLLPKSTSNEENMSAAFAPWHLPLDRRRESRSGVSRRSSRSCRHKKGVISTCSRVNNLSCRRSDLLYVFHAPDVSITGSRLSVVLAPVWSNLSGSSKPFPLNEPSSYPRTAPPCLCEGLRKAPHHSSRNHQSVRSPGLWLWSPSSRSLRSQVRVG